MKELLEARNKYLVRFPLSQDPMDYSASLDSDYLIKKMNNAKKALVFKHEEALGKVTVK